MWTPGADATFEAEFLQLSDEQVVLQRVGDNKRLAYRVDALSKADRKWLEDRAATRSQPMNAQQIAALVKVPEDADGLIRLPLRVYIVNGVVLKKDGVEMRTWVTPKDVEQTLMPEINRIWKPAGIQWELESVVDRPIAQIPNQLEALRYVQDSERMSSGKQDPKRVAFINALSSSKEQHPVIHNLFLFPYLGSTYQGFAPLPGNTAFCGVWTNKPSGGKKPPQQTLLTEELPMKIGSLARTTGHELGHSLGLNHPDKATQTEFQRLMGGKDQGYRLIPEEVELARKTALQRAKKIQQWADHADAQPDPDGSR